MRDMRNMNDTRNVEDIRDEIFRSIERVEIEATIDAAECGVIACVPEAVERGHLLGLEAAALCGDGDEVDEGDPILRLRGSAKQITFAEETLIGLLSKPSGIATATRRLVEEAAGQIRIAYWIPASATSQTPSGDGECQRPCKCIPSARAPWLRESVVQTLHPPWQRLPRRTPSFVARSWPSVRGRFA